MKNTLWLPVGFTACYGISAFLIGTYLDRGAFIGVATPVMLFVGGVSAAFLWLLYALGWAGRPQRQKGVLWIAGFVLPFAVWGSILMINHTVKAYRARKTDRQRAGAHLVNIRDEVLRSPKGNPIGVRVIYRVRFADGFDNLYYPHVTLHVNDQMGKFWDSRKEIKPPVKGRYKKGEYEIIEHKLPMFAPKGMVWAGKSTDPCFSLSSDNLKKAIELPPQRFELIIDPFDIRTFTLQTYSLKTFYEGAVKEGAKECSY